MHRTRSYGFTLIELMIVVAIIGILAAIALPSYEQYIIRARVTEGLNLASPAKASVVDNATNGVPYSSGFEAINAANATKYVSGLSISDTTGAITIVYSQSAGNGSLVLRPFTGTSAAPVDLPDSSAGGYAFPSGNVQWACGAAGASAPAIAGTLSAKYAPGNCR